jgi:hypothetical protein
VQDVVEIFLPEAKMRPESLFGKICEDPHLGKILSVHPGVWPVHVDDVQHADCRHGHCGEHHQSSQAMLVAHPKDPGKKKQDVCETESLHKMSHHSFLLLLPQELPDCVDTRSDSVHRHGLVCEVRLAKLVK